MADLSASLAFTDLSFMGLRARMCFIYCPVAGPRGGPQEEMEREGEERRRGGQRKGEPEERRGEEKAGEQRRGEWADHI